MRANLLSVLLGGLLVAVGYFLGAGTPSSGADVATGDVPTVVSTSASDMPGSLYVWRMHAGRVLDVTRYQAERLDDGRGASSSATSSRTSLRLRLAPSRRSREHEGRSPPREREASRSVGGDPRPDSKSARADSDVSVGRRLR